MTKRWWNDEHFKAQLEAKVEAGGWRVVVDQLPGVVIKVIYAGLKVELPDNSTAIINPDVHPSCWNEVTNEEFDAAVQIWNEAREEQERQAQAARDAAAALAAKQAACLHENTITYCSAAAAGCDINDTYCTICDKTLRRSWSTASDRDPDDHVSDWNWWVREHMRLYQQEPRRSDYVVVEAIEGNLPAHHCKPRPK